MMTSSIYRFGLLTLTLCALLALARPLQAQTGAELVLQPFPDQTKIELNTSAIYAAQANTNAPGRSVTVSINDTAGRAKLPVEGPWHPVVGYEHTWIHLDTTHPGLPNNLLDQSIGVGATLYSTDTWKFSGTLALGYAADNPYEGAAGLYAKASLLASYAFDAKSALQFSLHYNGNRSIFPDVPLPGFAYVRQESPTLRYMLGLPMSVHWEPLNKVTLDANYFLLFNANLTVGYNLTEQWRFFGSYDSRMAPFFLDDQPTRRIFFEQDCLEAGVTWMPRRHIRLTLAAGYAFMQRFSTGYDVRDLEEITKITDEPYLRAAFGLSF